MFGSIEAVRWERRLDVAIGGILVQLPRNVAARLFVPSVVAREGLHLLTASRSASRPPLRFFCPGGLTDNHWCAQVLQGLTTRRTRVLANGRSGNRKIRSDNRDCRVAPLSHLLHGPAIDTQTDLTILP